MVASDLSSCCQICIGVFVVLSWHFTQSVSCDISSQLFLFALFKEFSSMKYVSSVSVSSEETAKAASLLKQVDHDATFGDLGKALTAGCGSGGWLNLCDRPIAELFRAAEDSRMCGNDKHSTYHHHT